ncbi:MAG: hypothetical protein SH850_00485, partial [Planctomycetaceae bacterium]|nr:hypothetical protein [Planctomycetaceae bacterium]
RSKACGNNHWNPSGGFREDQFNAPVRLRVENASGKLPMPRSTDGDPDEIVAVSVASDISRRVGYSVSRRILILCEAGHAVVRRTRSRQRRDQGISRGIVSLEIDEDTGGVLAAGVIAEAMREQGTVSLR